jgi:hypothetical protein
MTELINQQIQRLNGLDNIVQVRPDIANNDNQVEMIQQIMNMRKNFNNTYSVAITDFNNSLDEYVKNQVKIMIIQRLIELRRQTNPEEFD